MSQPVMSQTELSQAGISRGSLRQPNQTIAVRCKLWRLGMGWEAIKYVCDLLALIRGKGGYVDQRLNAFGAC